jgi:hypothetical protein
VTFNPLEEDKPSDSDVFESASESPPVVVPERVPERSQTDRTKKV